MDVSKLDRAAELLVEFINTLDRSNSKCEGCGCVRFSDVRQQRSAQMLEAALNKVRRCRDYLYSPEQDRTRERVRA